MAITSIINCSIKITGKPIINFLWRVLWWISRMVIYIGSAAPKIAIRRSVNSGIRCPECLALNLSKIVIAIPARQIKIQQMASCLKIVFIFISHLVLCCHRLELSYVHL